MGSLKRPSGPMPRCSLTYEALENHLASYVLSLGLLKRHGGRMRREYDTALRILNGFAERYGLYRPTYAARKPRPTKQPWAQPEVYPCGFSLVDSLSSFWRDFGIGNDPMTADGAARVKLARCILRILASYQVIEPKKQGGKIVGIKSWSRPLEHLPLNRLFRDPPPRRRARTHQAA